MNDSEETRLFHRSLEEKMTDESSSGYAARQQRARGWAPVDIDPLSRARANGDDPRRFDWRATRQAKP